MNHRGRARARNLAYARNLAHALARDLALALDRHGTRDSDLAHALELTHALTHALDADRTLDRAHALDLVHTLDRAHARDRAHAGDRAHARDLTRDLTRNRAIDRAHNCASELIHTLDRARDIRVDTRQEGASGAGTDNPVPGRVPRGVVALATRVLPAWGRSRYREEFLGELTELARRERFGYALRVLTRAWTLRHALTEHALTGGVRTPDGSPVRRADR